VRIDLLLVMIEFIGELVLPAFAKATNRISADALRRVRHDLIAQMLEDQPYQDYLRDTLFLHAAGEPLTLAEAMKPGKTPQQLRRYFGPCLCELSFHRCLWQLSARSDMSSASPRVKKPARAPDPQAWRKRVKQSRQRASDPGGITWRPRSTPAPKTAALFFRRKK
jgi:hypothetical protein